MATKKEPIVLFSDEAVAERTNRTRRTIWQITNADPEIGIKVVGGKGKTKASWVFTQAHINLIIERYGETPKAGRPKRDKRGNLIESEPKAPPAPAVPAAE